MRINLYTKGQEMIVNQRFSSLLGSKPSVSDTFPVRSTEKGDKWADSNLAPSYLLWYLLDCGCCRKKKERKEGKERKRERERKKKLFLKVDSRKCGDTISLPWLPK